MLEFTKTVRCEPKVYQGQKRLRQLCKPRSEIIRRSWCVNITHFRLWKHGRNEILHGFKHLNIILLMTFRLQLTTITCSSYHPASSKLQKQIFYVAICSFSYLRGNLVVSSWRVARRRPLYYHPSKVMPLPRPKWNLTTKSDGLLLISQVCASPTSTSSLRWAYVNLSSQFVVFDRIGINSESMKKEARTLSRIREQILNFDWLS